MKIKIFVSLLMLAMLAGCGPESPIQASALQNESAENPSTDPQPGYIPIFEPGQCPFTLPEGKIEGQDIRCGTLIVPETRTNPEAGQVHLAVAVVNSISKRETSADPVVFVEGGPGVEVLSKLSLVFRQFTPFLESREMIFFDPRGVGYSTPSLDCPEYIEAAYSTLEGKIPPEQGLQQEKEAMLSCGQRLNQEGVNLSAYNVVENAADLDDLRFALGYEQWNLFSVSYGTRVVQELLRKAPKGIRSIVLDSTVSLEANVYEEAPANIDRALEHLFAACAAEPQCQETYPQLKTQLYNLVEELNTTPISTPVANLMSGEIFAEVPADGNSLLNVVVNGLYSNQVIPYLPKLIADTQIGDYTLLSTLRSNLLTNQLFISRGATYASLCHDETPFNSIDEINQNIDKYPHLSAFFIGPGGKVPFVELCSEWGITAADPSVNQPVSSDLPMLILAGQFDPASPSDWGSQVAANMSQAIFLDFPNIGHSVALSHPCPLSITLAFLKDPESNLDTTCLDEIELAFALPVSSADINLVPVNVEELGLMALAPENWIAVKADYYVSPDQSFELVFTKEQAAPLESFLTAWGVEGPGTDYSTSALEWTVHVVSEPELGKVIYLAVSPTEGGFYLTLVAGPINQAEMIRDLIFMPILQAFTVN